MKMEMEKEMKRERDISLILFLESYKRFL